MAMTAHQAARLTVAAALVAGLAACGAEAPAAMEDEAPRSNGSVNELMVSCGEPPGWPVSAMDGGIDSRLESDDVASALRLLAKEAGIDAPRALQDVSIDEAPWFVLAETGTTATVATGAWDADGPDQDAQIVELERAGEGWVARGWGDCTSLAPVIEPGLQWVRVNAAPDLDPASAELEVTVNEVECTSGRDPRPFLRRPTIVESDDSVTISWTSEAPEGDARCVGNPLVPQVVQLEEPLADRVLLDASAWPARLIANRR
ncbi:MAG TPA: hypothetical protein VFG72_11000 [Marmoricola sp.]|nr:hypothetical protein [Marmoricola sp.]